MVSNHWQKLKSLLLQHNGLDLGNKRDGHPGHRGLRGGRWPSLVREE